MTYGPAPDPTSHRDSGRSGRSFLSLREASAPGVGRHLRTSGSFDVRLAAEPTLTAPVAYSRRFREMEATH